MGIKDQQLPAQSSRDVAGGKSCIIMGMIDVGWRLEQHECTMYEHPRCFDQKPQLKTGWNEPTGHHNMLQMDTIEILLTWPRVTIFDINDRNVHSSLHQRSCFAQDTNVCTCCPQDMHAHSYR